DDFKMPAENITRSSSREDIKWLQEKLNKVVQGYPLKVDGIYGPKVRIAVLMYWEQRGWNKDGKDCSWIGLR
ncbi:MAG: peptidoglycan-binding domain-containing protein, partial [Anaerocolumna sp.]